MHLVICCCLKNCTCVLPPPPLHAVETPSFPQGFKREKQTASLCPSLPPEPIRNPQRCIFLLSVYHCFTLLLSLTPRLGCVPVRI